MSYWPATASLLDGALRRALTPEDALDIVVQHYAPHLLGQELSALTINRATGLAFADGDAITWESVRLIREAFERRTTPV